MSSTTDASLSFKHIKKQNLANHPMIIAAKEKAAELSGGFQNSFSSVSKSIADIKPVFNALVKALAAKMDKISKTGKEGQLPWAKAGIGNEGKNTLVKKARSDGRTFRRAQSASYRIANFV